MYSLYPLNLFFKFISLSPHCFNQVGTATAGFKLIAQIFNMNHNGVIGKLCVYGSFQTLSTYSVLKMSLSDEKLTAENLIFFIRESKLSAIVADIVAFCV